MGGMGGSVAMAGAIVLREGGAIGLLPGGAIALYGPDGTCPTCCGGGGGGPVGPCACSPVNYIDGLCGVPDGSTPSFPAWTVTVAGSVTYRESVVQTLIGGGQRVLSDVPQTTRSFSVTRVIVGRQGRPQCAGVFAYPSGAEPRILWPQNAPAGPGRGVEPELSWAWGNANTAANEGNGWAAFYRSEWQSLGNPVQPSVTAPALGTQGVESLGGSIRGLAVFGGAGEAGFAMQGAARWVRAGVASFSQTLMAGTQTSQELRGLFNEGGYSASCSGDSGAERTECRHTFRHAASGTWTGRRDGVVTDVGFDASYSIVLQLIRCGQGFGGGAGRAPDDPRAVAEAERVLAGCRGCGER